MFNFILTAIIQILGYKLPHEDSKRMESSEYSVVISQWMKTVMAQKRISANQWASTAGTSATNLTRFLNSDCGFIPSTKTIAKLATIAGSWPDFTDTKPSEKKIFQIPVFNLDL